MNTVDMDTASHSVHDPDSSRPALEAHQQCKRARFETSNQPSPLTPSEEALSQETRSANITSSFLHTSDTIHVKELFTDNIMVFAANSHYSSATKEFCSLFNGVGGSPRSSPKGERSICRSSRDLVIDTAFQDSGRNGYGSGHSAAEALCGALGLPSPILHESPDSLGMTDVLKRVTAESPDHTAEENEVKLPRSTQLIVVEPQPSLNAHPEDTEKQVELRVPTVFVWDLDETLIIFQTLSDGRYAALFDGFKDSHTAVMLGQRWERLILEICDEHFFYKQVEKYNFPNLDSLRDCDDGIDLEDYDFEADNLEFPSDDDNMRKLSYRHRYAGKLYEQGIEKLLSPEQTKEWHDLYEATDQYTDGWLTAGRQKLEEFQKANQTVAEANCRRLKTLGPDRGEDNVESASEAAVSPSKYNVLVTSGTLIPSLVKCLLFRLNSHFHHENIYSSREAGKLHCFQWIRNRLLPKTPKFCVIGDGIDECEAAQALEWPFVKIVTEPDALHRLPSLSFATVENYIKVVYGGPDGPGIPGF